MGILSADNCLRLQQFGLNINSATTVNLRLIFRGPCTCYGPTVLHGSSIDAYSTVGYHCSLINCFIGRYTTLVNNVRCGLGNHSVNEFSTSAAFVSNFLIPCVNRKDTEFQKKGRVFSLARIGHDVYINSNVNLVHDVNIGNGAVIKPNAVITKDVPPYAIVSGVNQIEGYRFSDEVISDLQESKWWEYDLPNMLRRGLKVPVDQPQLLPQFLRNTDPELLLKIDSPLMALSRDTLNHYSLQPVKVQMPAAAGAAGAEAAASVGAAATAAGAAPSPDSAAAAPATLTTTTS